VVRAEPVAALYEQSRIHHVGAFPTLEDQACSFTSDFDRKTAGFSPDRIDALVWAFSELLVEPMAGYAAFELARLGAAEVAARKLAEAEARKPKPNPAPGSVEWMQMLNVQGTDGDRMPTTPPGGVRTSLATIAGMAGAEPFRRARDRRQTTQQQNRQDPARPAPSARRSREARMKSVAGTDRPLARSFATSSP
jgi:hypothetical protein